MKGYIVALLELTLFAFGAWTARSYTTGLQHLDSVVYYWLCFTVLTGFWEFVYVSVYGKVVAFSKQLIKDNTSVWTMDFPWYYVCPNLLSQIFYSEYGAWADREYMSDTKGDYWSRLIESTHALGCGLFSFMGLVYAAQSNSALSSLYITAAMAFQLMNSILYMGEYFEQCQDKDSVNYGKTPGFPMGRYMSHRLFMWVNLFWTLCPAVVIMTILSSQ